MYEKMIAIAKRENNPKRDFLIVNKFQGKHIPVSPTKAIDLFSKLAEKIKTSKNSLVIGFCETATAIGFQIAKELKLPYIHTTRENYADSDAMFFSEEHSHATEQKLLKDGFDEIIDKLEEIIFVEDEITTGKTVLNIIDSFKKHYKQNIKFSVVAIINGMNQQNTDIFSKKNIDVYYILKTDSSDYANRFMDISPSGKTFDLFTNFTYEKNPTSHSKISSNSHQNNYPYTKINDNKPDYCDDEVKYFNLTGFVNTRKICSNNEYTKAYTKLAQDTINILERENIPKNSEILLLGTEEFMYPAIFVGAEIEKLGFNVITHSTTRSPICVSPEEEYPLNFRYEISSVYQKDRKTFIYNLKEYDLVYVLSEITADNFSSLIEALRISGNKKIRIVRWCE